MKTTIEESHKNAILDDLRTANLAFQKTYPGDRSDRQPVHTVYGGANLFKSDSVRRMGEIALRSLRANAADFTELARVLELPGCEQLPQAPDEVHALTRQLSSLSEADRKKHPAWLPYTVYQKVLAKLEKEAVEDFRIDFEDGFGNRPDEEEDQTAIQAAREVAKGLQDGSLPPFIGIRIKPFTEDLKQRGVRTLDLFLSELLTTTGGRLPDNFVVMLPKVTIPEQVTALVRFFEIIENNFTLPAGTLKMEMMVEATQAVMDKDGRNPLRALIMSGQGRCIAAHFGTYDYTASCNITARYQTMDHPVCDFAHHMTKVALAGTGIYLSDGATNVMPIGPHKGDNLTDAQVAENKAVVHRAWKLCFGHTMHSLRNGFYQGWDLNPAQLPMRYAAVYTFFLESYEDAAVRLRHFVDKAAQATLSGDIFDDAATGQGLLNYFLRAMNSGAIDENEATVTGLTLEEIRSRSFYRILQGRRAAKK